MWVYSCMLVQVVNATVYFDATWRPLIPNKDFYYGRILSVPALLKHALAIGIDIPDCEMLVCGSDGSAPGPASLKNVAILNGTHPPAFSPSAKPSREFDAVPVPMVTRGGPETEGYHLVGSARWNGTRLAAQSRGDGSARAQRVDPVGKQARKGSSVWNTLPPDICVNAFSMPVLTFDNRSLLEPLCYRQAIVDGLQGSPQVDASYRTRDRLDEKKWERYRLILVIGGNGGWSDRFKASLFHDSVSVLVDCGTHEWWYPLITEGVHYFRSSTSIASIQATVREALSRSPASLSKIADAAAAAAAEIFELDNVAAYMAFVAVETASKLTYTPRVRPGFERFTKSPLKMPGPSTSKVQPPLGFLPTDQLSAEQARARITKWLLLNDRIEALQALTHEGSDADAHVLATQVANEIFPPVDIVPFDRPLPDGFSFPTVKKG
eukprot:CAMPEP_0115837744 /NCGR_PEP_ID=MMETSP0287-20121206/5375_1 /TAXON_ID=412157 /ORGANISM="Chrysochromulina rotalis, Strain UIO044" /LENGTH=436 /DNA_ID=CAMNT_0003291257 /DNA_START=114 /DNA_END=1423 /DNA_ORIENTATION=-